MFTDIPSIGGHTSPFIASVEEAIADIHAGRMVVLMDDEQRENEGDLCMAAELVTPEAINFMATYGRGLICLALSEAKIRELGLPMMVADNTAPLGTAFTVSIDARRGITTGISAADRATTVLTAVREGAGPQDIVSPGHVFPLRARAGGVLIRTGQTEGAVDLARLAGLTPAGVICEVMRDDGTMARLPDLEAFAQRHGIKIATVADVIQYRLRTELLVHSVSEAQLPTRYGGEFRARVYRCDVDGGEHLALIKGEIRPDLPTLVRPHAEYLPGDVFGYLRRDTGDMLHRAMELIAAEGRGVILYMRREGRRMDLGSGDSDGPSTNPQARLHDFRDYGVGAQILRDVGVGKIRLLTNRPPKLVSLPGYGLEIVESVPLTSRPGREGMRSKVVRLR